MNWLKGLNGFYFKYQGILNYDVDPEAALQRHVFIAYWKRGLLNEFYSILVKFIAKALLVRRFQQTWSQFLVDFDRKTDDLVRQ